MVLQSRYFVANTYFSTEPSYDPVTGTTCVWGHCWYSVGALWNYPELRRITLTLLATSGPIRHISMMGWNGTFGSFTLTTVENYLNLAAPPHAGDHATIDFPSSDGFSVEFDADASSFPIEIRIDYDIAPGDAGYCSYGTRVRPDAQALLVVTDGMVALLAERYPWLAPLAVGLGTLAGLTAVPGVFCSSPPPPLPSFGPADFIPGTDIPAPGSYAKWMQVFIYAAWSDFCECLPATGGGPAPVDWPTPPPDDVLGAPSAVGPVVCDDSDLCTALNAIQRQLLATNATVALIRQDVQLIQRQKVPFGYLAGTSHVGLSGQGDFAVQGILGLAVSATTVPGSTGLESGDPEAHFGLGWITTGTAAGWRRSVALRHTPQWVDVEPDDTLVGYSLAPLVVVDIVEQLREP